MNDIVKGTYAVRTFGTDEYGETRAFFLYNYGPDKCGRVDGDIWDCKVYKTKAGLKRAADKFFKMQGVA